MVYKSKAHNNRKNKSNNDPCLSIISLRKVFNVLIILSTIPANVSFDRSVLLIHCFYESLSYAEHNISGAAHNQYLQLTIVSHIKPGVHLNTYRYIVPAISCIHTRGLLS